MSNVIARTMPEGVTYEKELQCYQGFIQVGFQAVKENRASFQVSKQIHPKTYEFCVVVEFLEFDHSYAFTVKQLVELMRGLTIIIPAAPNNTVEEERCTKFLELLLSRLYSVFVNILE